MKKLTAQAAASEVAIASLILALNEKGIIEEEYIFSKLKRTRDALKETGDSFHEEVAEALEDTMEMVQGAKIPKKDSQA